jgi:hypothetical protein
MGFTEILTIICVLLKAFGVITWSWWLVFLPEIIAAVILCGVHRSRHYRCKQDQQAH